MTDIPFLWDLRASLTGGEYAEEISEGFYTFISGLEEYYGCGSIRITADGEPLGSHGRWEREEFEETPSGAAFAMSSGFRTGGTDDVHSTLVGWLDA